MVAEILNIKTGEIRIYDMPDCKDEDANTFIWEEGNFSCDCNRGIFFDRATGEEKDDSDYPCGDDSYAVLSVKKTTGEVFYYEDLLRTPWKRPA